MSNHTIHPQGTAYQYDQLNRLVGADAYRNLDPTSDPTGWHPETLSGDYQTRYQYDANGNILPLKRNGPGSIHLGMDSLTYHWQYHDGVPGSGKCHGGQ